MLGFHIDMNVAQYQKGYLEKWLNELAALGYDTVIWEVENNIKWETCPECVSPDAFTKEEFKSILKLSKELNLTNIPLFQTIGHCEYVLKYQPYKKFAELPDQIEQYCPMHPELPMFLCCWIDEYIELFGGVEIFHIGADEARLLGKCPQCRKFVEDNSFSALYIQHLNKITKHLIDRGIRPMLWADMLLQYPESLGHLSRRIIVADWMYDIHRNNGKVWIWGQGLKSKDEISKKTIDIYGKYLFPYGDEPGREPETFYTADFLTAQGFDTITCPGSSSHGDNVFTPRNYYHMKNTYDSVKKGLESHLFGTILTSWTIHLFPWELQKTSIQLLPYIAANPEASLDDFENHFLKVHFGVTNRDFFNICGLLSQSCLFSHTATLGFDKSTMPTTDRHAITTIQAIIDQARHNEELQNCLERLAEYKRALKLIKDYAKKVQYGHEYLSLWELAAKNLINRSMASSYLLHKAIIKKFGHCEITLRGVNALDEILDTLYELKQGTTLLYRSIIKPIRREEMIHWIYDAVEHALVAVKCFNAPEKSVKSGNVEKV